jgi:hypothetical protein
VLLWHDRAVSEDPGSAGGELADGSDRSVPAPDVSARDWTRTRTSDATEPPPPVDVAVAEAVRVEAQADAQTDAQTGAAAAAPPAVSYAGAPSADVRTTGQPRRLPLVLQGLAGAAVAGLLAGAAAAGGPALVAAVVVLQVALVLTVLAVLDAPAARGAAVVAVVAGVAADAVVLLDDGQVDRVAGVVGLSLVAALLHQLVRRGRNRVTESLADTMLAVVLASAASCLLALRSAAGERDVLLLALVAAAGALLVGRLVDRVLARPVLAAGATRGWPGLLVGLAGGVGAALLVRELAAADVSAPATALLALAAAVTVATADLAVDLGATELRPGRRDARRLLALRPAAALLPYALLGPVVLLAGRLVLS